MATSTLRTPPFQWQPSFRIPRSRTVSFSFLQATRGCIISHSSKINTKALQTPSFKARSSAASHAISASLFDGDDNQKRYYMLGGETSVGKTNSAASLAVKFADQGHPTVLISFNPIRLLSDILDQDSTGGLVIEGLKSKLLALEVKEEQTNVDIMDYMDVLIEQFGESKVEFLMASASQNEAAMIWKLMLLYDSPEYSHLDMRVVFDTSLMDGEVLNLFCNQDMNDAAIAISDPTSPADSRLSRNSLKRAGELIRGSTEYVITTIPTVMAVEESARLHALLKKEKVHVRRLIVNRILSPVKTEDELRAHWMIQNDPELSSLEVIEAPLVHLEMRGIPALKIMGNMI